MRTFDVTIRVTIDDSRMPFANHIVDRPAEFATEIGDLAIAAAREEFASPTPLASIEANVKELL